MPTKDLILTRREKFDFTLSGKASETDWLADAVSKKTNYPIQNRSGTVLRWLEYLYSSGKWPEAVHLKLLSVEHLIAPADIVTGRDSIQQVLKRTRIRSSYSDQPLAELPEWINDLPKSIKLLNTAFDLVRHGAEMEVCLDRDGYRERYINSVRSGASFILAVASNKGKSTAQVSREFRIIQHTGHKNKCPDARNSVLLYAFINRVSRKYSTRTALIQVPKQTIQILDNPGVDLLQPRHWLDAEAVRLNAINDINRYRAELFRTQVEAEATRIRTMQEIYSAEVQAYQARILSELTSLNMQT